MTYTIEVYPEAQAAIAAVPPEGLQALAEVFAVLELTPWAGRSVDPVANPDAPLRNMPFGASGLVTYLILDRDERVDIV
ncbi:hypothetical protein, partial [Pseudonocardia asaccharolytica]|uniref:hypothetical protein n=1 Tax=Pseudonocardia asaccharolytica TaxID=54010 RepID=UPI0011BE41C6